MTGVRHLLNEIGGTTRGADLVVASLQEAGTDVVFALPAESINSLVDACRRARMPLVTVRHEGAAALMAAAYGKLTGRVGVCMATNGPGVTHLPVGAWDALLDRSPFLAICGSVDSAQYGTESFQEVDSAQVMSAVTERAHAIWTPAGLPHVSAFLREARARRTALALSIAPDVLLADARSVAPRTGAAVDEPQAWRSPPAHLAEARRRLAGTRPAILVGDIGARTPRTATWLDGIPDALCLPEAILGAAWAHLPPQRRATGDSATREQLAEASEVVVIGEWPSASEALLQRDSVVIHLSSCPSGRTPGRHYLNIVGPDLAELTTEVGLGGDPPARFANRVPPRQSAIGAALDAGIPADAVLCVEPSLAPFVHAQLSARSRSITTSFGARTPGYAVCAAIAAAVSTPDRPIVALVDDSGLRESMAELLTARKHDLPVSVILLSQAASRPGWAPGALGQGLGFSVRIFPTGVTGAQIAAEVAREPFTLTVVTTDAQDHDPIGEQDRQGTEPDATRAGVTGQRDRHVTVAMVRRAAIAMGRRVLEVCDQAWPVGARPAVTNYVTGSAEGAALAAASLGKTQPSPILILHREHDLLRSLNGIFDASYDAGGLVLVTVEDGWRVDVAALVAGAAAATIEAPVEFFRAPADPMDGARLGRSADGAADALKRTLADATELADDGPCVVHVRLRPGPAPARPGTVRHRPAAIAPAPLDTHVEKAVACLLGARSPVIVAGGGARADEALVSRVAEAHGWPIAATMGSNGAFDGHPLFVGYLGSSGHPTAAVTVRAADVVLALGVSNRGAVYGFWTRQQQVIDVNTDHRCLQRDTGQGVGVVSSVGEFLARIEHTGPAPAPVTEPPEAPGHYRAWRRSAGRRPGLGGAIRPSYVMASLAHELAALPDATVSADVGLNTLWLLRYGPPHRHTVWTRNFATMGFALPSAIAQAWAAPGRPSVAVVGDGGFAMTMGELAVAVANRLPVTVIVLDNGGLAAIRYEEEVMGWPEHGSSLWNGSFAEVARSFGALGVCVTQPHQLRPALNAALARPMPSVIQVRCTPDEPPMPAGPARLHQRATIMLAWARQGRRGLRSALTTIPGSWQY